MVVTPLATNRNQCPLALFEHENVWWLLSTTRCISPAFRFKNEQHKGKRDGIFAIILCYYDTEWDFNSGLSCWDFFFEDYYWQNRCKKMYPRWEGWGGCETGWKKIKIPVWPAVNLRLLTAQRSCCVTGFLMTLQQPLPQIALTWFISLFTTLHRRPSPSPTAAPPLFLPTRPLRRSVSLSVPPSPSVVIDTYTLRTGTPSPRLHRATGREHLSRGPPATKC